MIIINFIIIIIIIDFTLYCTLPQLALPMF